MNKQKQLIRTLTKNAISALITVVVVGVLYFVSLGFNSSASSAKKQAENAYNADTAKAMGYRAQIEKSGNAEKRFLEMQRIHLNPDYSSNMDAFGSILSQLKARHRLPDLKVLNSNEKLSDKPDLQNLDYTVSIRPGMSISMNAMSDMHVFSFLDSLLHEGNGLYNITRLKVTSLKEVDSAVVSKMQAGERVNVMQARIDFDWIGITPKETNKVSEAQP